jgi:hypothetical protein
MKKHVSSKKHEKNSNKSIVQIRTNFQCKTCQKFYKSKPGLWGHNKRCKSVPEKGEEISVSKNFDDFETNCNILSELKKMNDLSKKQELEMCKMIKIIADLKENQQVTTINNNNNNNATTINNTFNINIFLDEKCGNAVNLDDFIKNLVYERADTKLLIDDYVEGTCNIIKRNLEELPINKRPLHYLVGEDPHQQLMHIRQDNKWNIESELNWMQQIHADDDDFVVDKNKIYYALKMIDDCKLKYLGYYHHLDKGYIMQHGRLHREISRPDFKDKIYYKLLKMVSLNIDNLENIEKKREINVQ